MHKLYISAFIAFGEYNSEEQMITALKQMTSMLEKRVESKASVVPTSAKDSKSFPENKDPNGGMSTCFYINFN